MSTATAEKGDDQSPNTNLTQFRPVRQTQRERAATAGSLLDRVRAISVDPHIYEMARFLTESHRSIHELGGRPRHFPDWCLVIFGACVRVFGSASATARNLADPVIWTIVIDGARQVLGEDLGEVPRSAPTRDYWVTFVASRFDAGKWDAVHELQRTLGIRRANEVGLLLQPERRQVGAYKRQNVVGIDGKVFSSPVRTLETERVNRRTGELRPVRDDPARERYGEGGQEGIVWGTKFAIASVRSPAANTRVILGIKHFNSKVKGGEGQVFANLARDLARRTDGIQAFTVDGAWRGTHLTQVQTDTGCGVITPARRLTAKNGGITIGRYSYAAKPLPWSTKRALREASCGGHQIWAAAGTLFEQIIDVEGNSQFNELHRHQTKRDITRRKDGSRAHQFYAHYSMPCSRTQTVHTWWEPLLPIASDNETKFNRCEYLRVVPALSEKHQRVYGMRQDTESLNAQLERAFYGMRLPAWGVHRQTAVVLCAALAENAWALAVSRSESDAASKRPE
jgi:hypothetical protein